MSQGKLIVLTGPSGVGKGTIIRNLLRDCPELNLSISATTRKPRRGEIDGVHYHFFSLKKFVSSICNDEFLEWTEYADNYYGTPKNKVQELVNSGKWVLLEIELMGARKVLEIFPDALRIMVLPPSLEALEHRLRTRGKDTPSAIELRLERAIEEIAAKDEFDFQIVNDNLEQTIDRLKIAIFGENKNNKESKKDNLDPQKI